MGGAIEPRRTRQAGRIVKKMVDGVGFEPTYAHAGGFTIRCH